MTQADNTTLRRGRPPEIQAVRTLAARRASAVIATLAEIAADTSADRIDRVAAAQTILEYAATRRRETPDRPATTDSPASQEQHQRLRDAAALQALADQFGNVISTLFTLGSAYQANVIRVHESADFGQDIQARSVLEELAKLAARNENLLEPNHGRTTTE
ncbi:hypothetical protein [Burkholderia perseverans]|uniref:hypothetical protein n=1 Tax=Burkholderia perseverans TaxID=2615214 RepID=UPI001FEDC233|nr:hypothetical protein [Burkholderia perseverans]